MDPLTWLFINALIISRMTHTITVWLSLDLLHYIDCQIDITLLWTAFVLFVITYPDTYRTFNIVHSTHLVIHVVFQRSNYYFIMWIISMEDITTIKTVELNVGIISKPRIWQYIWKWLVRMPVTWTSLLSASSEKQYPIYTSIGNLCTLFSAVMFL